MSQLKEIKIIEETHEYLKIVVINLSFLRLVNFLIEQGKREEYHLVEMELLLYTLKESNLVKKKIGKEVYENLSDFLKNEKYMDYNLDTKELLNNIKDLRALATDKLIINGEIKALKNSPHSEFNLTFSVK